MCKVMFDVWNNGELVGTVVARYADDSDDASYEVIAQRRGWERNLGTFSTEHEAIAASRRGRRRAF